MQDFLEINNNWFYKKYHSKLQKRYWTFQIALSLFLQRAGEIIIETGCVREKDDWGAGNSTVIFGDFCKKYNRNLITVDNNLTNLNVAREETREFEDLITYELDDSLEFLRKYDSKIDLLFLDSLDCVESPSDQNIEAQSHALKELQIAMSKLHKDSIILIDDNLFKNGGKTKMCKEFLIKKGWICVMDYKQTLWIQCCNSCLR